MGIRWYSLALLPALLCFGACGGGGVEKARFASLGGTLVIPQAVAQGVAPRPPEASTWTAAEPFGEPGALEAAGRVDGTRVLRFVASAARRLSLEVEGAEGCLHSLDTGLRGGALDVAAGEVVDVVLSGDGPFRVRLDGAGTANDAPIPPRYWAADPFRDREIVVAPAPGWDAARIAALGGLSCVAESGSLCLLRAPREDGDERTRLGRLLARCARLRAAGAVRFAEPNFERRLASVPNDPYFDEQWALQQISVQGLWNEGGATSDAIIAIVDTGVTPTHMELEGKFVGGWDFIGDDDDPTDETADMSHGTMVAGIAAALTDNERGVAGVAWGARIMPLRVFDANGNANVFGIAQAIRFAAGLENSSGQVPAQPAHVINLSFAGVVRTQSEESACRAAHEAGSLVVAAVGNDDTTASRYPAAYPEVLGVGATTRAGARAPYSNLGGQVALAAPGGVTGDGIVVIDRNAMGQNIYRRVNGTSFAAPHVSAVAAMLMDLGALDPVEVRSLLEGTARDIGAPGRDDETGWGLVDAHAASLALLDLPAPAVFPGETLQVRLLLVSSGAEIARATTSDADAFAWSMPEVPAGLYRLVAGTDRDYDGRLDDDGELYGEWEGGEELAVYRSDQRPDLSIALAPR